MDDNVTDQFIYTRAKRTVSKKVQEGFDLTSSDLMTTFYDYQYIRSLKSLIIDGVIIIVQTQFLTNVPNNLPCHLNLTRSPDQKLFHGISRERKNLLP